jgi:hypothetical protein
VVVVGALVAAGGLGSCSADNSYIENADDSLYLRLPPDWVSYDEQEIYEEPLVTMGDGASTLDVIREVNQNWVVGFAAEDLESPTAALGFAANVPVGFAAVVQLDPVAREGFDVVAQRSFGWPPLAAGGLLDPVAAYRDDPSGDVELIEYQEYDVAGRGSATRIRAAFDGLGDDTVFRDVTVVVDSLGTELYVLSVGCYAHCFLNSMEEIDDVVSSFTLEDQR